MGTYYITTAIDYPNNKPHIGHAFEKIGADVQARYHRMQGDDVFFLMGNDENTVKISKRAAELGKAPKSYVDEMAALFKETWRKLGISNNDFIQTSEERHAVGCRRFIQNVFEGGHIYKKAYEGLYCEGCESFKTAKDLEGDRCPNHASQPLRRIQEENYFFALSKFRDPLLKLYAERPDFIHPATRRNEVLSLVESGLEDVSITRQHMEWGIRVPFDPAQTIYVWFDALLNYVTGIGYGTDDAAFRRWWPANCHVIGKDITRFHCALWPAMLMAAGIELPRRVLVHGFVLMRGEKMSKTLGNVVDPMELCDRFGTDAFRYVFMRECPFNGDGEFSYDRFAIVYNSDLANNIGNLYSRTLSMCLRYFDGRLEGAGAVTADALFAGIDRPAAVRAIGTAIEAGEYPQALAAIWKGVLDPANRYIDRTKPFELVKVDRDACRRVLVQLAEALRIFAILVKPFMPMTAETIYNGFSHPAPFDAVRYEQAASRSTPSEDLRVTAVLRDGKVLPLFPRIEGTAQPPPAGDTARGT
jgi:methionyl-tRNA synthetase